MTTRGYDYDAGHQDVPQSLNLYSYVENNPVTTIDPDGHCGQDQKAWRCFWSGFTNALSRIGSIIGDDAPPPPKVPVCTGICFSHTVTLHDKPNTDNSQVDNHAFAEWMSAHALSLSSGYCATYCREGLEAGGLNTKGHPADAKDYGPFLLEHGYSQVSGANYLGTQQAGDIIVFQPAKGHSQSGHIEMWDGSEWVSDFKQRGFSPYNDVPPSSLGFAIYRQGGQ